MIPRKVKNIMVIGLMIRKMEKVHKMIIIGTFNYPNGDLYDGEWNNDKRDGKGKGIFIVGLCNYNNGDKYNGYWVSDKRKGKGKY